MGNDIESGFGILRYIDAQVERHLKKSLIDIFLGETVLEPEDYHPVYIIVF